MTLGEGGRPCNHAYITRKLQPCLSRLNGMGGELPESGIETATCRVISLGPGMLVIRGLNRPREKNPTEDDGMPQDVRVGKPS
jgi:hypothetical protein